MESHWNVISDLSLIYLQFYSVGLGYLSKIIQEDVGEGGLGGDWGIRVREAICRNASGGL
jgi:hypothetical protein